MMYIEGLKHKYLVVKWEDIEFLDEKRKNNLDDLLGELEEFREAQGKLRTNDYVVINTDEPYIAEIIEIMKKNGHLG